MLGVGVRQELDKMDKNEKRLSLKQRSEGKISGFLLASFLLLCMAGRKANLNPV